MQISQERDHTSYTIRSCSTGQINIVAPIGVDTDSGPLNSAFEELRPERVTGGFQEIVLTESFIMTPQKLIRNWTPQHIDELNRQHLDSVTELAPEVILLGTGDRLQFPDQAIMLDILTCGIGMEVMDNPAACRTYNILMNEGRRVAMAVMV